MLGLLTLALPVLCGLVRDSFSRRLACRLAGGLAGSTIAGGLLPCPAAAPTRLPRYSWSEIPGIGPRTRRYALLTLSNGLRCVVASDESSNRLELAATVSSGSLDDPADLEGLAHLAEHVTLASDPAGFYAWTDAREGEVNGFTGERTTTFYGSLELGTRVQRSATAAAAASQLEADTLADVSDGCARFGALFSRQAVAVAVVRQEVGRVDDELRETAAQLEESAVHPV